MTTYSAIPRMECVLQGLQLEAHVLLFTRLMYGHAVRGLAVTGALRT